MKRIVFGNHLTLYLLLACVLFAGILAIEISQTPSLDIDTLLKESSTPPEAVHISRPVYTPPQMRVFNEILKRPLFNETREPPPAPKQAASNPAPIAAHIRLELEGVAITPEARIAVVRDLTTKEMLRLSEGANHKGWKLDSVQADRALFKRNQQTVELELELAESTPGKKPGRTPVQKSNPKQKSSPVPKTGNNTSASKQ